MQTIEFATLLVFVLAGIWMIRGVLFGSFVFCIFMVWNLFLAAIPAVVATVITNNADLPNAAIAMLALLWLLFLPNAYYVLTDFMHLNQKVLVNKRDNKFTESLVHGRGDPMFIFDSFLLYASVTFGALAGGLSLDKMYTFLGINLPTIQLVTMVIALILSAVGVYIGRYGRWNSWDALYKPHKVITDFYRQVKSSEGLRGLLLVMGSVIALELLSWLAVVSYR